MLPGRVAALAALAISSLATDGALAGGASPIYGVTIPDGDVKGLRTVGDAVAFIAKAGVSA